MNGRVKCVENQGITSDCMHVKCKSVVTIEWNIFAGIKFHFCHLATILWGFFNFYFVVIGRFSSNFVVVL
jgi:hypothetical protein